MWAEQSRAAGNVVQAVGKGRPCWPQPWTAHTQLHSRQAPKSTATTAALWATQVGHISSGQALPPGVARGPQASPRLSLTGEIGQPPLDERITMSFNGYRISPFWELQVIS